MALIVVLGRRGTVDDSENENETLKLKMLWVLQLTPPSRWQSVRVTTSLDAYR